MYVALIVNTYFVSVKILNKNKNKLKIINILIKIIDVGIIINTIMELPSIRYKTIH
jgi:hypothetical protein